MDMLKYEALSNKSYLYLNSIHKNNSIHVAAIIKRGKILAISTNQYRAYTNHPGGQGKCRSKGCGYGNYSIHAERNVVKQLGDLNLLRGASLYVVRIAHDNINIKNSEPCSDCQIFLVKCMKEYGLQNVYYTI